MYMMIYDHIEISEIMERVFAMWVCGSSNIYIHKIRYPDTARSPIHYPVDIWHIYDQAQP